MLWREGQWGQVRNKVISGKEVTLERKLEEAQGVNADYLGKGRGTVLRLWPLFFLLIFIYTVVGFIHTY